MIKKLLLPVFLFLIILMNAQSVYNFETENSAYENLTGSTSLNNGTIWDDPGYTIPLGFNFTFGTYTFSTIYILDWSVGGVLSSNPIDGGIVPLFIPIGQDIIDLGFSSGTSQSNISYKSEGPSGSKILKVEWNNVGFFEDSTESDFMNFQLWLHEGTNIVEYRYGPSSINNPVESFEGETGPQISLITSFNIDTQQLVDRAYFISGNPTNPNIIVLNPGDPIELSYLQGMMPNGTVYRFLRETLGVFEHNTSQFLIYPNPVNHTLYFTNIEGQNHISIINNLGQLIKEIDNVDDNIDVSDLRNGIYFIQIDNQQSRIIRKFIKE